jgi:hypothetical protein
MKSKIFLYAIVSLIIFLSGCATSRFYSDPGMKNESGLKFYTVRPYLLVELRSEKDNTIKTSVIYLPDVSNPQYMRMKPGMGSNEIKLAFTNSVLNTYGSVTESQLPETLESLAALLNKGADAVTQFTGSPAIKTEQGNMDIFRLYEIIMDEKGTRLKEVITAN